MTRDVDTQNINSNMNSLGRTWSPRLLSVLRIATALLFLQHGTAKLLGFPHVAGFDNIEIASLIGVAGIIELVGGVLVLAGWYTRPAAFILSGQMAVAYFLAHAPDGFFPLLNKGELAALFSFVFLYLAVAGGGTWSIDNLLARRSADTPDHDRARSPMIEGAVR
jgi:putative oxidoreductase